MSITGLDEKKVEGLIEVLDESAVRGTFGHGLACLLGLADEASPYLGAVFRRLGKKEWVEAAEKRMALRRFVDETMERPMETWRRTLVAGTEHHGSLMVIILGNLGLRHLPGRPMEALELVAAARACGGLDDPSALDVEIRWLLDAVEAVAHRVGEPEPRTSESSLTTLAQELKGMGPTIHPELVADTWWLYAVDRRLAGKLLAAEAALDRAVALAEDYGDRYRKAEYELERGFVLELAGRDEEAYGAAGRAVWALRDAPREHPLVSRAIVQQTSHLVTTGRYEEAEPWVENRVARVEGWEPTVARLRGCVARGSGRLEEAEILLESAEELAHKAGDVAERGLASLERVALLDECKQWARRDRVLAALQEAMMACPHGPSAIVTSLAALTNEPPEAEPLDPSVLRCLRLRMREWQGRQQVPSDLRVM